ncbi:hypothetical protein [Pseudonocardia spinosispora]|uniref:hypothetical protein n=1 Tax=Pseudonocardia spinosispora TaxID=103441 RepID=UPI00146F944C|nr:hypothetical protein [Pseudonocardia spinosispora]
MGFFYWGSANAPSNTPTSARTRARGGSSEVPLHRRRIDLRDYFQGVIDRPRVGVLRDPDIVIVNKEWSEAGWRRTPTERVRLDSLYATQKWISRDGLKHHSRPGARPDGGDLPLVVRYRGRNWLWDGHHRAITSMERGEIYLLAHVKDFDRPGQGRR